MNASSHLRRFLPHVLLGLCFPALSAFADLQWYGDPAKGREIFNNLNFEGAERYSPGTGTILPATDPVHGPIWRVHKPAADKRAEIRGAAGWSFHVGKGGSMQQGVTYYIGWRYKFTLAGKTDRGWACFQWKAYDDPKNPALSTQNYPFTMSYDGQDLSLTLHGPEWPTHRERVVKVWTHPVKIGEWVDIVLVVKPSLDPQVGFVEIYCNGEHQTLLTGGTRVYGKTMDGLEVAPKWGAYGGGAIGTDITVDLAGLRIGTDLASVAPAPHPSVKKYLPSTP
ncbi:MAG: heparin lyase I family protein [Opitutaceae bacterium]